MATHRLAPTFFPSTADTQREQRVASTEADLRFAVMPATFSEHRCEARMDSHCLCLYKVLEAIEEESVVIEQGKAIALNRSTKGILLFMPPSTSREAAHRSAYPSLQMEQGCDGFRCSMD